MAALPAVGAMPVSGIRTGSFVKCRMTESVVPNTAKIVDYFYRAVHQVTLAAKQLTKDYYHATTISHSYFDGCSNGGKMGLLEATESSRAFPTAERR